MTQDAIRYQGERWLYKIGLKNDISSTVCYSRSENLETDRWISIWFAHNKRKWEKGTELLLGVCLYFSSC